MQLVTRLVHYPAPVEDQQCKTCLQLLNPCAEFTMAWV